MGRVARGDEAAFAELVGRYGGRLLGVAKRLLGSRADAEDAVQRALLQCYLGACTYRSEWAVSTWLYRILTNVCVDELRRRRSRSGELEPPARPDPPGEHLDLRRALGRVPTEADPSWYTRECGAGSKWSPPMRARSDQSTSS